MRAGNAKCAGEFDFLSVFAAVCMQWMTGYAELRDEQSGHQQHNAAATKPRSIAYRRKHDSINNRDQSPALVAISSIKFGHLTRKRKLRVAVDQIGSNSTCA